MVRPAPYDRLFWLPIDMMLWTEWVKVPAIDSMLKIVCRTSNRIFVGPEKC